MMERKARLFETSNEKYDLLDSLSYVGDVFSLNNALKEIGFSHLIAGSERKVKTIVLESNFGTFVAVLEDATSDKAILKKQKVKTRKQLLELISSLEPECVIYDERASFNHHKRAFNSDLLLRLSTICPVYVIQKTSNANASIFKDAFAFLQETLLVSVAVVLCCFIAFFLPSITSLMGTKYQAISWVVFGVAIIGCVVCFAIEYKKMLALYETGERSKLFRFTMLYVVFLGYVVARCITYLRVLFFNGDINATIFLAPLFAELFLLIAVLVTPPLFKFFASVGKKITRQDAAAEEMRSE